MGEVSHLTWISVMNGKKLPLLDLLCKRFPFLSRKQLYSRILCGEVYVNNEKTSNAKVVVEDTAQIRFSEKKYVSRGGIKLSHVINKLAVKVKGIVFLDVGCSTGGFTDCLLKSGAKLVYSIDVGYNQLDYSLRINPKVKVMERVNIMKVKKDMFNPIADSAVCDISFRSIRGAASHILNLIKKTGFLLALVKPQFEWTCPDSDFSGVVTNRKKVLQIVINLIRDLSKENVFVTDEVLSPIYGSKGNMELFLMLKSEPEFPIDKVIADLINLFSVKNKNIKG